MNGPQVHISCVSNVFVKQMRFVKAGDMEQGHSHCFDHLTLLASGKLRLTALGKSTEFVAPHHIFIKAGIEHELLALEDETTVHCIHAIRNGERIEDIIDPSSIPVSIQYIAENAYPMTFDDLDRREASNAV